VPGFDLMIVSDGKPDLLARVDAALRGSTPGRVAIQLREPMLGAGALYELAFALRELTRRHGAKLLVNDRIDVALAVEADGVHLPERGLSPTIARRLLGPAACVGASRHDRPGLERAAQEGAHYATLSPLHSVPGKGPALGHAAFERLSAGVPLAIYALGGVTSEDIPALRLAGVRGVAVVREVLSSGDPEARTRRLLSTLAGDQA
jgi:thiamine-phosphate pyrophosphorylase